MQIRVRVPVWTLCILLPGAVSAQSAITACEAPAAVAADLEKAAALATSPMLPLEARTAELRRLLEAHPADLFVNRAYGALFGGYALAPVYERMVLQRIEKLYRENPSDPARTYLYAIAITRRDPTRSQALLEQLVRDAPDAPWPVLALSGARSRAKDEAGARQALERFFELCPNSLDSDALSKASDFGTADLRRKVAGAMRRLIESRTDATALSSWPTLWQLEFQLTPASGHDALRTRIRADLARLREMQGAPQAFRLDTLKQGYALVADPEGRRWAQEELLRTAPESRAAAVATTERWAEENPSPRRDATPEDRQAFVRKNLEAGNTWFARWPNFETACASRYRSVLGLPDLPLNRLETLGKEFLDCAERNRDFTFGFTDQPLMQVADQFAAAGVDPQYVLSIVNRGLQQSAQRLETDLAAGTRPAGLSDPRALAQIERWFGRRVRILVYVRSKQTDSARSELEEFRKEVAAADPRNLLLLWRGLTGLSEAALKAGRLEVVRETLSRMSSALSQEDVSQAPPQQKIQKAQHEASYWKTRAGLAEAEDRKADATAYYIRAAEATPGDYDPTGRSAANARSAAMWTALGGTTEALEALRDSGSAGAQASRWIRIDKALPGFSLQDYAGRPVRLGDMEGKTLFINVWATWCGPCQAELPFVQRMHDTLKGRDDVRVLTFNIDENPGVIGQYLKDRNFSFPVVLAREFIEEKMKVEGIPRNWIVDGKGVLRLERQAGADESFLRDALAAIDRTAGGR